ncbi:MAG: DUF134 domain-containing protein [Spirochaetes bacterium]|jgi:predicted DNA-binding protein (UPF0251 family)|nr:DUF134 domain-containing protein [Spirochaetota bacterium]
MPRKKICRTVEGPPPCKCFKPQGVPGRFLKSVTISVDEYECLRLADYEDLEHKDAAERLGVSRSIFTRLLAGARHKLSKAIIEGCELIIEGGEYKFTRTRMRCLDCYLLFETVPDQGTPEKCPECSSTQMHTLNHNFGRHGNGKQCQNGKKHGRAGNKRHTPADEDFS